jgi:signal peptidase I
MNYIKRLIGLPGETIAIYRGKLYVLSPDKARDNGLEYGDFEEAQGDPNKMAQLWRFKPYVHHDDDNAIKLFRAGLFDIVRKPPAVVLAMMRLVYDNDHQAKDLNGPEFVRWLAGADSGWEAAGPHGFRHKGEGADVGWLRYRHVVRGSPDKPQLITDFMGYNTWEAAGAHMAPGENWASDLIVECDVQVNSPQGVFALELSKGPDRFQARFDLKDGKCTLLRLTGKQEPVELKSAATRMNQRGTYKVRFANADDRLIVWVDGQMPFGDGFEYPVEKNRKLIPVKENDLDRPVSVGAWANVNVSGLKVYRDTYYTTARGGAPSNADVPEFNPADPDTWKNLEDFPVSTYYVQPEHFLCLGDNSPESSDGRNWGLVPRRLLLGRALMVYYPFARAGRIR